MTDQEMATEITKAWLAKRGDTHADLASKEIRQVYLAVVKAIRESYKEE